SISCPISSDPAAVFHPPGGAGGGELVGQHGVRSTRVAPSLANIAGHELERYARVLLNSVYGFRRGIYTLVCQKESTGGCHHNEAKQQRNHQLNQRCAPLVPRRKAMIGINSHS